MMVHVLVPVLLRILVVARTLFEDFPIRRTAAGGAFAHQAQTARYNPADRLTGLGMFFERLVLHRLLYFEATRFFSRFLWDGFVNVGSHGEFSKRNRIQNR